MRREDAALPSNYFAIEAGLDRSSCLLKLGAQACDSSAGRGGLLGLRCVAYHSEDGFVSYRSICTENRNCCMRIRADEPCPRPREQGREPHHGMLRKT